MFTALLDTCVLWPSLQRDVLLSFAIRGLYRPAWSSAILEELEIHEERKLLKNHSADEAGRRARNLVQQMRSAFDDAEVEGWEPLDGSFGLPDVDDEHVLAAAVVGGAGVIVTHNLRDFPTDRLPPQVEVQSPQVFAHHTVSLNPAVALRAIQDIADRSGKKGPPRTVDDILTVLEERYTMTDAAAELRSSYQGN